MSADYIKTIQTERSRSTRLHHWQCFSLELLHIIACLGQSPLTLHEHETEEKEASEGGAATLTEELGQNGDHRQWLVQ